MGRRARVDGRRLQAAICMQYLSALGQWPGTVSPYTMIATCSPRRDAAALLLPQRALCMLAYNTHRSRHAARSVRRLPRALRMLMTMAVTPPPPSTGALRKLHDTETASAQNLTIRWVGAEAGGNNLLRTTLPRSDWLAARDLSVRAAAKPRPRREQKAATITCLQRPPLAFLYSLSAGALGTHARPQRHARPIAPAPPTRPIPAAAALACEACIRACMTSAATQTARPPGQQDQPRSQRAAVSGQAGPSASSPAATTC